jgi:hypothetical protein
MLSVTYLHRHKALLPYRDPARPTHSFVPEKGGLASSIILEERKLL